MEKTKQKLPKWFKGQLYDKGAEVTNRFGGDSCYLNNVELSIYDFVVGANQVLEAVFEINNEEERNEATKDLIRDLHRGLDWFKEHNAKAYMVLLD